MLKRKKEVFVCQVTPAGRKASGEREIKLVRISREPGQSLISDISVRHVKAGGNGRLVSQVLKEMCAELSYRNQPFVIGMPGEAITFRSLRLPGDSPDELRQMVSLQAAKFLPFPAQDLLTSYEEIRREDGYTLVSIGIAHQEAVNTARSFVRGAGIKHCVVAPSSWGLAPLYGELRPHQSEEAVLLLESNGRAAEIAVIRGSKLLLSRTFSLQRKSGGAQKLLAEQVRNTLVMYAREHSHDAPAEIFFLGPLEVVQRGAPSLENELGVKVHWAPYAQTLALAEGCVDKMQGVVSSIAGLVGLGAAYIEESLHLLSSREREVELKLRSRRHWQLAAGLTAVTVALFLLGAFKLLDNKSLRVGAMQARLAGIESQAQTLGAMQKKMVFLRQRLHEEGSVLDALRAVHVVIPEDTVLTSLAWEDGEKVVLKGQTPRFSAVSEFAAALQKQGAFSGYTIKVKYVTKRHTDAGETVEFQIMCRKE